MAGSVRDTARPHRMRPGQGHNLGLRPPRDGGVRLSPEPCRLRMGKQGKVSLGDGCAALEPFAAFLCGLEGSVEKAQPPIGLSGHKGSGT